MPSASSTTPGTSSRARWDDRATRGSPRAVAASTTPAATSTAYTSRQEPTSAEPGESSGPTAIPAPTLAPQMPVASARSRGSGNVTAIIPRLAAIRAAPPMPCTTRASTKTTTSCATAATRAPAASTSAPATNVRRRPKSSATRPAVSRNAPSPMLIELRIHVRPATPGVQARHRQVDRRERRGERHQRDEGAERGAERGYGGRCPRDAPFGLVIELISP